MILRLQLDGQTHQFDSVDRRVALQQLHVRAEVVGEQRRAFVAASEENCTVQHSHQHRHTDEDEQLEAVLVGEQRVPQADHVCNGRELRSDFPTHRA